MSIKNLFLKYFDLPQRVFYKIESKLNEIISQSNNLSNGFDYNLVSGSSATINYISTARQIVSITNTALVTITLGSIAANGQMEITFKDAALSDSSLDIIINPDAADTLDGNTTLRYSRNGSQKGSAITIYNNNINEWYLI